MRLILVSSRHHPSHGGIGAAVWSMCRCATEAGWHIDLVTRPSNGLPPNVATHLIRTIDDGPEFTRRIDSLRRIERIRPYRYGLWSLAVAQKLLKLDVDADAIEFVDCQAEGFVALTSRRVRRKYRGVPVCIQAHTPMFLMERLNGMDSARFGRTIYHEWEMAALRHADGVITPSRMLHEALPPHAHGAVIPHPLPLEGAPPRPATHKSILLIGNVEPNKGVDTWARSLNAVLRAHPDAKAILIGSDTPTSPGGGSMAAHCTGLIRKDLRARFEWIHSASHDDIQSLIRGAAIVVVPSRFESFSCVAAEAIAAGCPVIVSDRVAIVEWMPSVPVVPANDVEAWAAAQITVLSDAVRARITAAKCRSELAASCNPKEVLESRRRFVDVLASQSPKAIDETGIDSMDAMQAFLCEVEIEERRATSKYSQPSPV